MLIIIFLIMQVGQKGCKHFCVHMWHSAKCTAHNQVGQMVEKYYFSSMPSLPKSFHKIWNSARKIILFLVLIKRDYTEVIETQLVRGVPVLNWPPKENHSHPATFPLVHSDLFTPTSNKIMLLQKLEFPFKQWCYHLSYEC